MITNPTFIDRSGRSAHAADPYSRLFNERIIFLFSEIDDNVSASIISQLLLLEAADGDAPIQLYINSPGGSVTAGLAIFDVMKMISCPVHTVAVGSSASMAAFLVAAGTKGMRYALPHAQLMIHQPTGGVEGQTSDILIVAELAKRTREELNHLLADFTGKTPSEIQNDTERDRYMTAAEAKAYGLIDHILS